MLPEGTRLTGSSSFADYLASTAPELMPGAAARSHGSPADLAPHATTIVAATFPGGVVMAGDRRATMGNIIAQRDIQKVFPADEYSVVGIAGAAGVTGLLGAGASPLAATLGVAAGSLAALAVAWRHLLPHGSRSDGPAFALPRGVVLFIGLLCFVAFLAEGAMLDWSAVFLTTVPGVEPSFAGLGYVAFSVTMTIGRLTGDRIVQRLGAHAVILAGTPSSLTAACPPWRCAVREDTRGSGHLIPARPGRSRHRPRWR